MAKRRNDRRSETRATAQSGKQTHATARIDPIGRVGGQTLRTRSVLDINVSDYARPVSASQDYARSMAAVTDAIRAGRVGSINRLNAAHQKATSAPTPTRSNKKQASQRGTIRAASNIDPEIVKTKSSKKPERSETLRDPATCKPRPEKTRGMGTSRAFVPWCGRRG